MEKILGPAFKIPYFESCRSFGQRKTHAENFLSGSFSKIALKLGLYISFCQKRFAFLTKTWTFTTKPKKREVCSFASFLQIF